MRTKPFAIDPKVRDTALRSLQKANSTDTLAVAVSELKQQIKSLVTNYQAHSFALVLTQTNIFQPVIMRKATFTVISLFVELQPQFSQQNLKLFVNYAAKRMQDNEITSSAYAQLIIKDFFLFQQLAVEQEQKQLIFDSIQQTARRQSIVTQAVALNALNETIVADQSYPFTGQAGDVCLSFASKFGDGITKELQFASLRVLSNLMERGYNNSQLVHIAERSILLKYFKSREYAYIILQKTVICGQLSDIETVKRLFLLIQKNKYDQIQSVRIQAFKASNVFADFIKQSDPQWLDKSTSRSSSAVRTPNFKQFRDSLAVCQKSPQRHSLGNIHEEDYDFSEEEMPIIPINEKLESVKVENRKFRPLSSTMSRQKSEQQEEMPTHEIQEQQQEVLSQETTSENNANSYNEEDPENQKPQSQSNETVAQQGQNQQEYTIQACDEAELVVSNGRAPKVQQSTEQLASQVQEQLPSQAYDQQNDREGRNGNTQETMYLQSQHNEDSCTVTDEGGSENSTDPAAAESRDSMTEGQSTFGSYSSTESAMEEEACTNFHCRNMKFIDQLPVRLQGPQQHFQGEQQKAPSYIRQLPIGQEFALSLNNSLKQSIPVVELPSPQPVLPIQKQQPQPIFYPIQQQGQSQAHSSHQIRSEAQYPAQPQAQPKLQLQVQPQTRPRTAGRHRAELKLTGSQSKQRQTDSSVFISISNDGVVALSQAEKGEISQSYYTALYNIDDNELVRLMNRTGVVIQQLDDQLIEKLAERINGLMGKGFIDQMLPWVKQLLQKRHLLKIEQVSQIYGNLGQIWKGHSRWHDCEQLKQEIVYYYPQLAESQQK